MTPVKRARLLLSLQRALLGEVFASLRALSVEWGDDWIEIYAFVDGPISERDAESLSVIETEVIADFPWSVRVHSHVMEGARSPKDAYGTYVFLRRGE